MPLWLYDGAFSTPDTAEPFEDLDDEWLEILAEPEVTSKDRKLYSPAICGAEYPAGCTTKNLGKAVQVHALVLDVDVWFDAAGQKRVEPFTLDELKEMLGAFRFIAWNSFSSTELLRKWRVVLPLAFPMPIKKYRPLWQLLNTTVFQHTMAEGTKDAIRLGFCHTVGSELGLAEYQFHIGPGARLDWTQYNLEDDTTPTLQPALKPTDFTLAPDASSPAEALSLAKRIYARVGADVAVGSRHETLLQAALRLWYDWAAPDAQFVFDVLKVINGNFDEPKSEADLWAEVHAAHERTLGENRVEQPSPYGHKREPLERASRGGFAELARALSKKQKEGSRILARAIKHVSLGEAVTTEPAEAKNVVHLIAKELAAAYPKEKSDRLLDLVRPSLNAQRALSTAYPIPSDEEFVNTVKYAQNAIRRRVEERDQIRQDKEQHRIAQAFKYAGVDRAEPYTVAEYRKWENAGFSDDQWILQHNREFYFWINGGYFGPVTETVAKNFFTKFLAPAKDRVKCWYMKEGEGKLVRQGFDEIVQEFGSMVVEVERSFVHSRTQYDEITQQLVLGRQSMRALEPLYDADIDTWLHLLAKDKYLLLEEWLLSAFHLDRAGAVLMMSPPPGSGKNLLAYGVARLWTESGGPTAIEDTGGQQYPAHHLETCPVVFCDEQLPMLWQKQFGARLKKATSELSRRAKQPYVSDYELSGAPRYVFAGNGPAAMLAVKNFDSLAERQALVDRVLILNHTDPAAAAFLRSVSNHRTWVEGSLLARHIHWLNVHRPLGGSSSPHAFDKRFLGADPDGTSLDTVVAEVRADRQFDVLEWIYTFLTKRRFPNAAILTKGGSIYLSSALIAEFWDMHDPTKRGIKTREVTSSVAVLAPTQVKLSLVEPDGSSKVARYRKLETDKMIEWVGLNDADMESFIEGLKELEAKRLFKVT